MSRWGIYGHSQGAIVAANIAADPTINERYNVTTLLTAGGPTAGADLPDHVNALHLENGADAVPGLDGAPTPRTPTRTVVTLDTTGSNLQGYPHGGDVYADAVEGMSGDPGIGCVDSAVGGAHRHGRGGGDDERVRLRRHPQHDRCAQSVRLQLEVLRRCPVGAR